MLRLEWRRVDFNRRVAWLDPGTTKNGEGRGIPLNRDAVLALRSVQGEHPIWCFTYQGKRMEAIGSAWKRSLANEGINYHPQSGWYDESPQRGLDTKALLTSSAPDVSLPAPGS